MEKELAFDLFYGVGYENGILELSHATFAEELQLQEILKASMIASEVTNSEPSSFSSSSPSPTSTPEAISSPSSEPSLEELERAFNFQTKNELRGAAVCEAIKKSGCPVCHRLSCSECTIPQGSGFNCNRQQRTNWDEKERKHSMARSHRGSRSRRQSQSKFNGRRMGDNPQTCSSATKRWGFGHPNPSKGSELDNNRNVANEDDCDSLDDEDGFDSDRSQKSHESRKKSKWFKEFFQRMDALHIKEIDETLWHCPACRGGPGAIKWYRSIRDLIAHSQKIGARRVKLHRELAELLEEELRIKGTAIAPADQTHGNWKGLKEDTKDHEIVWPPMVVIMNTMTSITEDGKCVGMGSRELLEHFSSYPALKAQHCYDPQGHRGSSVLIFESSVVGYLDAERLNMNFVAQGLDRFAWDFCKDAILPGGERQLYGVMAVKEDLDIFNQHCQGASKIKYELKSYEEAVLNEIKKMSEGSQQFIFLKDRLKEERKGTNAFERSLDTLSRNLQRKMKDIHIFQQKVQLMYEQHKEEMESQEEFYKDQIKIFEARVKELEKLQESDANPLHNEEPVAAPAVACHMEEQPPCQNTSNLSVDEG